MANIVVEFDKPNHEKVCRFTIKNFPDAHVMGLGTGDEIGFDLIETKEFFYVTIARKVCLAGFTDPIYVICAPRCFNDLDELAVAMEKFRAHYEDDLLVDD